MKKEKVYNLIFKEMCNSKGLSFFKTYQYINKVPLRVVFKNTPYLSSYCNFKVKSINLPCIQI